MELFEYLEDLAYNLGKFIVSKLESVVDVVPEGARPKAKNALEMAKKEARKVFDKTTVTRQFLENLGYSFDKLAGKTLYYRVKILKIYKVS